MSSRVQKGGQKFRPVAKPRGKAGEGVSAPNKKPPSTRDTSQAHLSHISHGLLDTTSQTLNTAPLRRTNNLSPTVTNTSPTVVGDGSVFDGSDSRDIRIEFISSVPQSSALDPNVEQLSGEQNGPRTTAIQIPSSSRLTSTTAISQSQLESNATQTSDGSALTPQDAGLLFPDTVTALQALLQTLVRPEAQKDETSPSTLVNSQGPSTTTSPSTTLVPQDQILYNGQNVAHGGDNQSLPVEKPHDDSGRQLSMSKSKKLYQNNTTGIDIETEHVSVSRPRKKRSVNRLSNVDTHFEPSDEEENNSGSETQAPRKRGRTTTGSSTSSRGRRSRTSSAIIFDPDADPGEDLDPTVVTMAAICEDTGQGRVSSKAAVIQRNHLAWKAANREKRAKMRAAAEARKYGMKENEGVAKETSGIANESPEDPAISADVGVPPTPQVEESPADVENGMNGGFNYGEVHSTNRFTARVRIGPNGETIIDNDSLVVEQTDNDDETENYQHVEESDQTKFTNSATYGRKVRGSRWSVEETEEFYNALSQFGVNFELISYVLPGRDRNSCKNKFKTEDKKNPGRVKYCLDNPVPYDIRRLSKFTKKDFSGPTPEIRVPEKPTLVEDIRREPLPEQIRNPRKRSKTPAPEDVEVVGDIETFDVG